MSRFDFDDEVIVRGTIVRETDSALLIRTEDDEEIWFPLAEIEITRSAPSGFDEVLIPAWLARDRGL